ncbi:MAG: hypothetical protein CMM93_04180 [Rickettsiales bacterium]|nr:hypothetical protein [Rickettsiales bacterium]|tara:strand:- start:1576 stop:2349 length:774 start_codon:yes stop_codon:yes gene_type:complete
MRDIVIKVFVEVNFSEIHQSQTLQEKINRTYLNKNLYGGIITKSSIVSQGNMFLNNGKCNVPLTVKLELCEFVSGDIILCKLERIRKIKKNDREQEIYMFSIVSDLEALKETSVLVDYQIISAYEKSVVELLEIGNTINLEVISMIARTSESKSAIMANVAKKISFITFRVDSDFEMPEINAPDYLFEKKGKQLKVKAGDYRMYANGFLPAEENDEIIYYLNDTEEYMRKIIEIWKNLSELNNKFPNPKRVMNSYKL